MRPLACSFAKWKYTAIDDQHDPSKIVIRYQEQILILLALQFRAANRAFSYVLSSLAFRKLPERLPNFQWSMLVNDCIDERHSISVSFPSMIRS